MTFAVEHRILRLTALRSHPRSVGCAHTETLMRKHNFYAGPSTLPLPVLEEMNENLVDYHGMGLSLIETSRWPRSRPRGSVSHLMKQFTTASPRSAGCGWSDSGRPALRIAS